MGGYNPYMAPQLGTTLDPDKDESKFKILYQITLSIDYSNGGEIEKLMRGVVVDESVSATSPNNDLDQIINMLNENILRDKSKARINDLDLTYSVSINGRADRANIDYHILLEGDISNYRIGDKDSDGRQLVDLGWRGISAYGPIVVDGVEVNMPISAIKTHVPDVYEMIRGTDVDTLLSKPIMNGDAILEQKLDSWHFLFDPTGINIDAGTFGLDDSITGTVLSTYTMGESSLREGPKSEIEKNDNT